MKTFSYFILGVSVFEFGWADSILFENTIREGEIIERSDVRVVSSEADSEPDLSQVIGMEARRILYKGSEVAVNDLRAPSLVRRNDAVNLKFARAGLEIEVEARALSRGSLGEKVRVMNLASRNTVNAMVQGEGLVVALE